MAKPYVLENEVQSTIAAGNTWTRGTDVTIVLTSAAEFDSGGGFIRVGGATSFALLEFTGISTNTLTGVTPCTLGVVVSSGDEAKEWPAGTVVSRVWMAEDISEFPLLLGRAGGQTLTGSASTDSGLTLKATSGVGTTGSNIILQVGNNGATEAMRILHDGKVGIGLSPAFVFDVKSAGQVGNFLRETATEGTMGVFSIGVTGGKTAGSGPSVLFYANNDADEKEFIGRVSCLWVNPANGSEHAAVVLQARKDNADQYAVTEVLRATGDGRVNIEGTLYLKEIADAKADVAAYGQVWVHDTEPNELWFTDDAGTDTQISPHPQDAPAELYTHGPSIDLIDKRVQRYLGVIFWQNLKGELIEETFAEYNARRAGEPGHVDLVKGDWEAWRTDQRRKWKAEWIAAHATDDAVPSEAAAEAAAKAEFKAELPAWIQSRIQGGRNADRT